MKVSAVFTLLLFCLLYSARADIEESQPLDNGIDSPVRGTDSDYVGPDLKQRPVFAHHEESSNVLEHLYRALDDMQDSFFEIWIGGWPTAIDWTAAVINTHVTTTLNTFSRATERLALSPGVLEKDLISYEGDISTFFEHNVAFYFGENAFSLRNQAFDDMLWVVLGWLESTKFIRRHDYSRRLRDVYGRPWHGTQFSPSFAHRARVFYDLAARGWDTSLCGGGMDWNSNLAPYKNAITNQLFISASIGMFLYFPGDYNSSPFLAKISASLGLDPVFPHDPRYLDAAIEGYDWLKNSNMTNDLGLYVDGYHIKDWSRHNKTGTGQCDERNEMVYTYNQGVILSGLRGLWEATGHLIYLEDGHELVRNVMAATGWDSSDAESSRKNSTWAGLGRSGILEEMCDHSGNCSQDAQTFKGIFFMHLAQFCEPLPWIKPMIPRKTYVASKGLALMHRHSCLEYAAWAEHNAKAAMTTRDAHGRFGTWWGHGRGVEHLTIDIPSHAVDYRNNATILTTNEWTASSDFRPGEEDIRTGQTEAHCQTSSDDTGDLNDRGRGRTVETQGGGVAVLRASWELSSEANAI